MITDLNNNLILHLIAIYTPKRLKQHIEYIHTWILK